MLRMLEEHCTFGIDVFGCGKVYYNSVGASHGNFPHDENFGYQVMLKQIGIQATLR
jgi:hypothetical protein